MSNIIKLPSVRRLKRQSGKVFEIAKNRHHKVWLRFSLPKKDRVAAEDLLYGHLLRLIHKLHGFDQAKGFKIDVLRGGNWHELPYGVKPKYLKDFLIAVDHYCERGLLEVQVDEVLYAKSKRA